MEIHSVVFLLTIQQTRVKMSPPSPELIIISCSPPSPISTVSRWTHSAVYDGGLTHGQDIIGVCYLFQSDSIPLRPSVWRVNNAKPFIGQVCVCTSPVCPLSVRYEDMWGFNSSCVQRVEHVRHSGGNKAFKSGFSTWSLDYGPLLPQFKNCQVVVLAYTCYFYWGLFLKG